MTSLSVCFVSGCNVGTTFEYRVLHKQEQLALLGVESVARHYLPHCDVTLDEALAHDVLYLYRVPYDPFIEDLIQRARWRGIPLVFDTDDLVFAPDLARWVDSLNTMPRHEAALYYEGVWRYRQSILACDYLVTSTEYLAELARPLAKPTSVHRNALSGTLIQMAEPMYAARRAGATTRERLVIGYVSGTATHNRDFLEVSAALCEILGRYPSVELHILGPLVVPSDLSRFGERVRNLPLIHWTEVPQVLDSFDINLGPLERENPFCRGKSEVKYIEAAVLGIPTVASRIDAFEYAIRDGETGFLAGDTDEWIAKLERLLDDPTLRRSMGDAARTDVLARYTPQTRGTELLQTLQSVRELYQPSQQTAPAPDAQRQPLVLNWLFTEPIPGSGGHADALRMINLLADFGHHNNVYMVPYKRMWGLSDREISDFVERHFADLRGDLYKWTSGPVAESDALLLTYWATAYMVDDRVDAAKVFYFVQDWEPFFYPMGVEYLRAEQTYKMGFSCITLGRWLTLFLRQRYGADADYFDLAVDHKVFYPRPGHKSTHPRICFYARPSTPRRLFPLGVDALHLVQQHRPDAEILFYGADDAALAEYAIPFPFTNRGVLSESALAELFSSCDIGLVFSPTNCSLVPTEMMACRCAVVDLNLETVQGVLEHDVNALLAAPTAESIAAALLRLLDDDALRQRLVETAYQQIQQRSWEKSARQVEAILYEKLNREQHSLIRRPVESQPGLPGLADLPAGQRQLLDEIHAERRRPRAWLLATTKSWTRRLMRYRQRAYLNGKRIHTLEALTARHTVGQTFVAQRDNLHRVDILIGTYGRRNTRDLVFHLKESPSALQALATVRVNTSLLADNAYARFMFQPQPDSARKSYYFCLESPDSTFGDAVTVWAFERAKTAEAHLYRDRHPSQGHLVFGAFYRDDRFGETGERPLLYRWTNAKTLVDRLLRGFHLLFDQGPRRLWQEIVTFLRWKTDQFL